MLGIPTKGNCAGTWIAECWPALDVPSDGEVSLKRTRDYPTFMDGFGGTCTHGRFLQELGIVSIHFEQDAFDVCSCDGEANGERSTAPRILFSQATRVPASCLGPRLAW